MTRPVKERMADAKRSMLAGRRARTPRCFYLTGPDYAEFEATKPSKIDAMFALKGNPPAPLECLAFDGIAVRLSTASKPNRYGVIYSKLYCCIGTAVAVPIE